MCGREKKKRKEQIQCQGAFHGVNADLGKRRRDFEPRIVAKQTRIDDGPTVLLGKKVKPEKKN